MKQTVEKIGQSRLNMPAVPLAGSIFLALSDPTDQRYKTIETSSWGFLQPVAL